MFKKRYEVQRIDGVKRRGVYCLNGLWVSLRFVLCGKLIVLVEGNLQLGLLRLLQRVMPIRNQTCLFL